MNGWTLDYVQSLPDNVYDLIVEELKKEEPKRHTS